MYNIKELEFNFTFKMIIILYFNRFLYINN